MDKAIKLNPKERKELAISEISLLVIGIIGLGAVIWFAWARPTSAPHTVSSYASCVAAGNPVQTSYPSVCVTEDGAHYTNPADKVSDSTKPSTGNDSGSGQQPAAQPAEGSYLTIQQWGVRAPLLAAYKDMKYTFTTQGGIERASFTFQRFEDAGFCKDDIGATMTRSTTENTEPFSPDNPQSIAHAAGYYYYLAYGGSPCYDPDNQDQMKLVNQINNGNPLDAVKQTLAKLQAS